MKTRSFALLVVVGTLGPASAGHADDMKTPEEVIIDIEGVQPQEPDPGADDLTLNVDGGNAQKIGDTAERDRPEEVGPRDLGPDIGGVSRSLNVEVDAAD